jgi:predicted SprT family Zn-dependent metalloprotease
MNKKIAKNLAIKLIKDHNLIDLSFDFDSSVRRFGCYHTKEKKITLSRMLTELNPIDEVRDVILHEIAHALAPAKAHHNKEWKEIAISIGCRGTRIYSNRVVVPKHKYSATCKNCGRITLYNRKRKISCGKCSPRFNKKYLLKFKLL